MRMMTPGLLERASAAFRRGYRECYAGAEPLKLSQAGTFYFLDYMEGFEAALAEMKLAKKGA
jgi:hypothetical protein